MLRRIKNDRVPQRPDTPAPSAPRPQSASPAPRELEVRNPDGRLGEILVAEKIITSQQLEEGLAKRKQDGGFLGQALIELGHIDQDTLTLVLIKQCKIPHLNLLDYTISPDVKQIIPIELCGKYNVLPIDKMGKILTVAMVDPLNSNALEALRTAYPELRIKPILCDWPHFQEVFQQFAAKQAPKPVQGPDLSIPAATLEPEEESTAAPVVEAAPLAEVSTLSEAEAATQDRGPSPVAAFNVDDITSAIREGMRETMAALERRVAEASDLLRKAQQVEQASVAAEQKRDLGVREASAPARTAVTPSIDEVSASSNPAGMTLENFIVGANNKPAVELARAVAKSPGAEQNPLFVCGDVGLGKTHLITAIGTALKAAHGGKRVGMTSAGRFVDDAMSARDSRGQEAFRRAFESWDVVILDDVQFLAGRVEAQEDLFHIFNALQKRGKQIILAADRAPEKLGLLEKRLVSRFDSGVIAQLNAPEWETRVKILRHYAGHLKIQAPDDVVAMIAMRHTNDVRRLVGSLRKIAAAARSNGGAITAELASRILAESVAEAAA